MFEKIVNFIERGKGMMFSKGSIREALGEEVALSREDLRRIALWKELYEREGGLHLPAALAFEMARRITLELNTSIKGGSRGELLDKTLRKVVSRIRIPLEYGCAKGGLVIKPYVEGDEIKVDFIQPENFMPLSFNDNGEIVAAVFVETATEGDKIYTRLEKHKLSGGVYEISNRAFKGSRLGGIGYEVNIGEVPRWKDLAPSLSISNVKKPLFGYFKPAIANTADTALPVGTSIFANAVNLIEDADKQYERLLWEFESGERAVIANSMAFKRDKKGNLKLPDRRLYHTLDVEDVDFFKEWSPAFRESDIAKGLDLIMRQIEFNCGFAYGTLSVLNDTVKTAEEIRASRERSFTTITDNQKALKTALSDLIYAMDVWCTLYNLAPICEYSTNFDFGDSVAVDRKLQFEEKKALLDSGVISPWEFRMWYFGEDEESARKMIKEK